MELKNETKQICEKYSVRSTCNEEARKEGTLRK